MNPSVDKFPLPEQRLPAPREGATAEGGPGQYEVPISKEAMVPVAVSARPTTTVDPGTVSMPAQQLESALPVGNSHASPMTLAITTDDEQLNKEYVSKAKAIVAQTKNDPFLQSKELSKIKTEFLNMKRQDNKGGKRGGV